MVLNIKKIVTLKTPLYILKIAKNVTYSYYMVLHSK
jgi:hypothetical protein